MAITITPGITIEGGITFDNGPQPPPGAPSYGTSFVWDPNSYFTTWTGGGSTTSSALGNGGDTTGMVWTLYYTWQAITLNAGTSRIGMSTWKNGTQGSTGASGYYSTSSVDNTLGSFPTATAKTTFNIAYANYVSGGLISGSNTSSDINIPANRYFLIGITGGVTARTYKTQAQNLTAYINDAPAFTIVNKIWWAPSSGPTSGIPDQLGGPTAGYTEYSGYVNLLTHAQWSLT